MLVARLREALGRRVPATASGEGAQRAAVAVVLTSGPDPAILFVKREVREGDPWSGHMAFPGGFMAAREPSPAATARREALEETGLDLSEVGELLGQLDDVFPRSPTLPPVIVTPVVFGVSQPHPVSPRAEVQEAVWLPASAIFSVDSQRPFVLDHPSGQRVFDSIVVQGYTIWGLTERVLSQLRSIASLTL